MAWKKTNSLLTTRLNQHGISERLIATRICEKARELHPALFEPVSFKNGCLHVELTKKNQLPFVMIQGKLLEELNSFTKAEKLPRIERVRLTISTN